MNADPGPRAAGIKIRCSSRALLWATLGLFGAGFDLRAQNAGSSDGAAGTNSPPAQAPAPASLEPKPGEFNNSVTIGIGQLFPQRDEAQMMRRLQLPKETFGGVEEFHLEQEVQGKTTLTLDGRGMADLKDYALTLDLRHPEVGFLRGGYREFRTWYDGSGGFSPTSNAWVRLYDDEFHLDRGQAWVQAGLTLPHWPVLSLRYAYDFREGRKDSTIWGDYNLNAGFPGAAPVRGIVPTFLDINEKRHTIEGDVTHTLGKTDLGLGVRYEAADVDNARNIRRRPGEANLTRTVTQKEEFTSDLFNVRGSSETRFSDRTRFTLGYAFTRLDTDLGGSRIYGANYYDPFNPTYLNRQARDEGFQDLTGGSRMDQYVANLNLLVTPYENVVLVPSFRVEHQDQSGFARFNEINVVTTNTVTEDLRNTRDRSFTDLAECLELRYTGFTNWALYARAELGEGWGGLSERETEAGSGVVDLQRDTDSRRWVQKYTAGANWYPHRKINLGGQYYYKARDNRYDHDLDTAAFNPPTSTNDLYPAFIQQQAFDTHDVNVRVTVRPRANLSLVSRYDFQISTVDTRGDVNHAGVRLSALESGKATTHLFSESVSWSPLHRLYLQSGLSYVMDRTETPASNIGGTARGQVQDAANDYWTANTMVGYALTERSDVQVQYTYYRADNYSDNSLFGLAYGAGAEQHGTTTTYLHRLRKNLLWKLQYGFFTAHDQTSGGHNDFSAHLVYSSLQYLF